MLDRQKMSYKRVFEYKSGTMNAETIRVLGKRLREKPEQTIKRSSTRVAELM
jgi:hypothetical protein